MSHRLFAAAAVAVLVLQGCAQKPPLPAVSSDDMNEGIAKSCTFAPAQPVPGKTVESTITMSNDGWCAFRASESSGKAFELGLVKQRPQHGDLLIRKWNGETRVEYNPLPSFVGTDKFLVALRPAAGGADASVSVAVTVTRGAGVAAVAAPAAEEATPVSTKTTRRSTRSTKKR